MWRQAAPPRALPLPTRPDLEQALFGLSLLPASRPAAQELVVCGPLAESLQAQLPEGLAATGPAGDVDAPRDAVAGGGARGAPRVALPGVGEWQVRLGAHEGGGVQQKGGPTPACAAGKDARTL